MPEQPIVITEHDVKEPNLLLRGLRKVTDRLLYLGDRIGSLERKPQPPSFGEIRRALEATGSHPIYIGNLLGQAAEPQVAKVTHFATSPTGQTLQQLRDNQLVTVGSSSTGQDLYRVLGGNPNSLLAIQLGSASAPSNMVTTNSSQDIGPSAAKAVKDNWSFDAGLTVTAGGITVNSTGGQFDSAAQYSAFVYAGAVNNITSTGIVTISFDTAPLNQGSVYDAGTPTRLTPQDAGVYQFSGQVTWVSTSTSLITSRRFDIQRTGVNTLETFLYPGLVMGGGTLYVVPFATATYPMTTTDYIEMKVSHAEAGVTDTVGGVGITTFMWLHKLC